MTFKEIVLQVEMFAFSDTRRCAEEVPILTFLLGPRTESIDQGNRISVDFKSRHSTRMMNEQLTYHRPFEFLLPSDDIEVKLQGREELPPAHRQFILAFRAKRQ